MMLLPAREDVMRMRFAKGLNGRAWQMSKNRTTCVEESPFIRIVRLCYNSKESV